jgi:hypothetical protein
MESIIRRSAKILQIKVGDEGSRLLPAAEGFLEWQTNF